MTTYTAPIPHADTRTDCIDLVFHDTAITQFLFPASEMIKVRNWSYVNEKLRTTTQTNHYRRLLFFLVTICAICVAAGKLTLVFPHETRVIVAPISIFVACMILLYAFDLTGLRTNFEFNRDASKFADMLDEFYLSRQWSDFLNRFPNWRILEDHSAQRHEHESMGKKLLRQIITSKFQSAGESKEAFSQALNAFLKMWPRPNRTSEHMRSVMFKFGL